MQQKEIIELRAYFKVGTFDKPTVLNAMVNFRLILEKDKKQEKYKYLNLYCNWMLHNEIKSSMTALRILDYLTDSLISHNNDPKGSKHLHDAVIEGLNIHSLQKDILNFGEEYSIDLNLLRLKANWQGFAYFIIFSLVDRTIKFPSEPTREKAKKIYESIHKKACDSGFIQNGVIEMSILNFNGKAGFKMKTLGNDYDKPSEIYGNVAILTMEMYEANQK